MSMYDFMNTSVSFRHRSFSDLWHRLFISLNLPVIYKPSAAELQLLPCTAPGMDSLLTNHRSRTCRQFYHRLNACSRQLPLSGINNIVFLQEEVLVICLLKKLHKDFNKKVNATFNMLGFECCSEMSWKIVLQQYVIFWLILHNNFFLINIIYFVNPVKIYFCAGLSGTMQWKIQTGCVNKKK